jgi:hypothetical protein
MEERRRQCKNDPNVFCYICGEYMMKEQRRGITNNINNSYEAYFGMKIGHQDNYWEPNSCCSSCTERLRKWTKGTLKSMPFGIPMMWLEPKNHTDDCYFCTLNMAGFNRNKKKTWTYPNLESARRPVPHSQDIPVPIYKELPSESEYSPTDDSQMSISYSASSEKSDSGPQIFAQKDLNDLIRDLGLSKESSELLASRLLERNLLQPETKVTFYRRRERELLKFFSCADEIVFCCDIGGLLIHMGLQKYDPNHWRLFIDSSKRSLKCVLLHNGNKFAPVPIGHSTTLKEDYESVRLLLDKISYETHRWIICVDLKMVNFLLGQQSGYTKFPCFICLWDSRDDKNHWIRKQWSIRENMDVGSKNVINEPLVDRDRIVFPPLHIKLGLIKQYVKSLDQSGACFAYIKKTFPGLSIEKIKAGIFDGPQIRKLINDPNFTGSMTTLESAAWSGFVRVVRGFLSGDRASNYQEIVADMLTAFKNQGARMSIKIHFLFNHLDNFPENLVDTSEEQGERFHQDLKVMEKRYQGRWDVVMMADYCWSLMRETNTKHHRKSLKRSFTQVE